MNRTHLILLWRFYSDCSRGDRHAQTWEGPAGRGPPGLPPHLLQGVLRSA